MTDNERRKRDRELIQLLGHEMAHKVWVLETCYDAKVIALVAARLMRAVEEL